jgi:hypothetical protein
MEEEEGEGMRILRQITLIFLYQLPTAIGYVLWPVVYAVEYAWWSLMGKPSEYEFWSVK